MNHASNQRCQGLVNLVGVCGLLALTSGCLNYESHHPTHVPPLVCEEEPVPNELCKVSLPEYRVEPPDILLIDAVKLVPKSPYHIEPLDVLLVRAANALPDQPIDGPRRVDPDGTIALGPDYGSVKVSGLSLEEAQKAITEKLKESLRSPEVVVSLAEPAAQQPVEGEHLVGPDGTVNLGTYGDVYVAGMTLNEAKAAIEDALSEYLEEPEVSLDIFAYNSKVYYVITQGLGAGQGDGVASVPITGNETVLDAMAQVSGLQPFSSQRIWIARPAPDGLGQDQILTVDWKAITSGGGTATNYQLLPGDRVFIAENRMLGFANVLDGLVQPFERAFGFSLLGIQTVQTFNRLPNGFRSTGAF